MFTTLVKQLSFSEGPRWHDGHLYYSDFYRHVVEKVDVLGNVTEVLSLPTQPSGLGWMPDGSLLVVSMLDRKLMRLDEGGVLTEHADLSGIATWHCNDMVVDQEGRAYVGNFGFDLSKGGEQKTADLALVTTDGAVKRVAGDMHFPNGSVITPDGKSLIVAETMAQRLTAFDIHADGTLTNRRVWADLGKHFPDGICLDAGGGIWVADPVRNAAVRVEEGGKITETLSNDRPVFACMLGGEDRKRLFICTASGSGDDIASKRDGCIEFVDVEIAGAGLP